VGISTLEQEVEHDIQSTIAFAKASPEPDEDALMTDIYA
jgi:TPP-dependent pyruvate/acetoin dehydrogenase alpha subunit